MSSCKLIVNNLSGNAPTESDVERLTTLLHEQYDTVDTVFIDFSNDIKMSDEVDGYDALAVCGGDGTLNSAINAVRNKKLSLIYVPCGTLNDTAKSLKLARRVGGKKKIKRVDLGQIGDTMFAYVLAGGTFTAIGYKTKIKTKKRLKFFAYLAMVLREYKVHKIHAKITLKDKILEDDYTLIMALNASRCFGFRFNRLNKSDDGKAQLMLIKAPKRFLGRIKLFFPLFRAFFIGFNKEKNGKHLKFLTISDGKIELFESTVFTVDGEKIVLDAGEYDLKILKQKFSLVVF